MQLCSRKWRACKEFRLRQLELTSKMGSCQLKGRVLLNFLLCYRPSFATASTTAMIIFTFKEDTVRQITLDMSCSIKKVLESEVGFGKKLLNN